MASPVALPLAPPTAPVVVEPPVHKPSWPSVIGLLAMLFGAGGIVLTPLLVWWSTWMTEAAPSPFSNRDLFNDPFMRFFLFFGLALDALLFAAGVSLYLRGKNARRLAILWSAMQVIASLAGAFCAYRIQCEQFASAGPVGAPGMPGGAFNAAAPLIGFFTGLIQGCLPPVLLLIWMRRLSVREYMSTWK